MLTPPRNSTETGDFATYVERELPGALPPGKVDSSPGAMHAAADAVDQIQQRPSKSLAGWLVSLISASVLSNLAYLALTEKRIVLGGKQGGATYEGAAASVVGFALFAVALLMLWRLTAGTRFSRISAWLLLVLWLVCAGWFVFAAK